MPPKQNELVYLMGVLHLEDTGKTSNNWIFESYKNAIPASNLEFKELHDVLGQMYATAISNAEDVSKQLDECNEVARKAAEARRREEEERAKKAKKGKKGKDADEPSSAIPDSPAKKGKGGAPYFDKNTPDGFKDCLEHYCKRPFLFGPIEFEGLDLSDDQHVFDPEEQCRRVNDALNRCMNIPSGLCTHGTAVTVKGRNLKRRSTILKHARFLRNLQVVPKMPVVVEKGPEDEENADE